MSQFVGRYKGGHSHNSSFTLDVTADTALSEGLTAAYRNDPRLGAIPSRVRLLVGAASFRLETRSLNEVMYLLFTLHNPTSLTLSIQGGPAETNDLASERALLSRASRPMTAELGA